jgi:hypothetical protein
MSCGAFCGECRVQEYAELNSAGDRKPLFLGAFRRLPTTIVPHNLGTPSLPIGGHDGQQLRLRYPVSREA